MLRCRASWGEEDGSQSLHGLVRVFLSSSGLVRLIFSHLNSFDLLFFYPFIYFEPGILLDDLYVL